MLNEYSQCAAESRRFSPGSPVCRVVDKVG